MGEQRTRYYVHTAIWHPSADLSAYARLVYCFMSFCCDRSGRCFPSVAQMAYRCGCGESTVRRAIQELIEKRWIEKAQQFRATSRGVTRRTSNAYTLLPPPIQTEAALPIPCQRDSIPLSEGHHPPARNAEEIHDKQESINTLLQTMAREGGEDGSDAEEFSMLLEHLELDLYEDRDFVALMEIILRNLFFSEESRVGKRTIPRAEVREHLWQLDIHCIDALYTTLMNRADVIKNIEAYLTAGLFEVRKEFLFDNIRARATDPKAVEKRAREQLQQSMRAVKLRYG